MAYVQDYDERYPMYYYAYPATADHFLGGHAGATYYGYWAVMVSPYISNFQIWRCPSTSAPISFNNDYGMNCAVFNVTPGRDSGDLKNPAGVMFAADKQAGGGPYVMSGGWYACSDRHNGGMNCTFADGHAKWWKASFGPIPGETVPNTGSPYAACYPTGANKTTPDSPEDICYLP